jgi:Co/Zn/Cd efflux system component
VLVAAQETDAVLHDLSEGLAQTFGIAHSTIQLERELCGARCHQTRA